MDVSDLYVSKCGRQPKVHGMMQYDSSYGELNTFSYTLNEFAKRSCPNERDNCIVEQEETGLIIDYCRSIPDTGTERGGCLEKEIWSPE